MKRVLVVIGRVLQLYLRVEITHSMINSSEEYPARFKATLANFRSYCQKNSRSAARFSATGNLNSTMTKYRSIRDIKIIPHRHDLNLRGSPKKQSEISPLKPEASCLALKNTDVIEMIRMKLKEGVAKNSKVKTESNVKEEAQSRYSKKTADLATYLLQSIKLGRKQKRKKVDLAVTHTKCDLLPRN